MANRAAMVDPDGGTTTYSYDARNGLASLVNPLQEITTWQYDAVGRIVTMTHANGARAAHTYNGAGWLTQLVNAKSDGTTITSHDYSYDAVGNPTLMVEATGYRFTWTYDALNQLTAERGRAFSAFSITYSYDPVGNRLTKLQSGVTATYTYDAADELALEDAAGELTTYAYDENGNTLLINAAGQRTTLTWGYEDEVLVIHAPEHVPVTMTYDGDHMRRRRQESNAVINYLWDGAQAFIETQAQDATLARYTLAPFGYGDLVSQRRSDATRFYHFDALGSTRALSDSAEAVSDTYAFEAFGKRIATSGSSTNVYQWVGKLGYLGEGRLDGYLLRRRCYRTGPGRFVSRDPVPLPGLAHYRYVANRPTTDTDASGLLDSTWCLAFCSLFPPLAGECLPLCDAALTLEDLNRKLAKLVRRRGACKHPGPALDDRGRETFRDCLWFCPGMTSCAQCCGEVPCIDENQEADCLTKCAMLQPKLKKRRRTSSTEQWTPTPGGPTAPLEGGSQ